MNGREHYLQLLDGTEHRRAAQRPRPLRLPQRDGPTCQVELLLPTVSHPGPPKESGRQQLACPPAGLRGPRACFLASSPVCWTPVRAWSLPCPGAPSMRLLLEPSLHPHHHLRSGQPGSSSHPPTPATSSQAPCPEASPRVTVLVGAQGPKSGELHGDWVRAPSLEAGRPFCELAFHHHVMPERQAGRASLVSSG